MWLSLRERETRCARSSHRSDDTERVCTIYFVSTLWCGIDNLSPRRYKMRFARPASMHVMGSSAQSRRLVMPSPAIP